jgi:hypothetical protein
MKYQLETIPVWDALGEQTECPLCLLQDRAERRYVSFFLGNSVMVPEMRVEVNRTGFCTRHFSLLLEGGNKLGLALMTHTHLIELVKNLKPNYSRLVGVPRGPAARLRKTIHHLSRFLSEHSRQCLICDRINSTLRRYAFTVLYLWQRDEEFKEKLLGSRGFCLPHMDLTFDVALEVLSRASLRDCLSDLVRLQEKNFERLENELLLFTQKFDHLANDTPWENARDALPRAIQKLTGLSPRGD